MTKPQPAPLPTDRPLFEELEPRRLFALNVYGGDVVVADVMNPDGSQKNASAVTVPFNLGLRITDASKIQMRGYLTDPTTGAVRKVVVGVTEVTRDPNDPKLLHLTTDGLVPRDAKLVIQPGALRDRRDRPITEQNVRFPKGASPAAFTFSRRALVATDHSLFSRTVFADGAAPASASNVVSNDVIRHDFANFLQAKVAKGTIDRAKADATLARYDDARVNEIIPSPNLRAALLSLVGTFAEPAIATMLDGQNVSGRPFTVIDFTDETSPQAEVAETKANGVGRLRTILKPQFAGEPFQVLGAYLAHEALHQDADDGQQEEIVANTVENFIYAQQALVDGRFVSANTPLVKRENDKLLAMLNSGHAKAGRVGLSAGAVKPSAGVFAGGTVQMGGPIQSFEDLVRREYVARDFGSYSTAGNDTLLAYYKNLTGTSKSVKFGDALIADLDANQKVITESNMMALAGLLKLTAV